MSYEVTFGPQMMINSILHVISVYQSTARCVLVMISVAYIAMKHASIDARGQHSK